MSEDSCHLKAFGDFLVKFKEPRQVFNNNQPINHVSILGRNLLFRVITFIPWYVLNYAKYKFLNIWTYRTHLYNLIKVETP